MNPTISHLEIAPKDVEFDAATASRERPLAGLVRDVLLSLCRGLVITPGCKKIYAANGLTNDVSVNDPATDAVVATLMAGDGPWGIAVGH